MRLNDPRGYATHMREIMLAFGELGHNVFSVLGNENQRITKIKRKNDRIVNRIRKKIPVQLFEKFRIIYDLLNDIKYFFRVKEAIQKFKPDFIYERYTHYHNVGILVSKIYQKPIILEYNCPITERNVYYNYSQRKIGQVVEKKSISACDAVVTVSGYLKEYLVSIGIDSKKITVIPNGVNDKMFQPYISGDRMKEKYNITNKRVVGFVGGFCRWHGIDALLKTMPELIKEIKDIHLLMVGEGPTLLSLKNYVNENGLSKYVTFTGSVAYEHIPQYIAAMDITIIPSTDVYMSPIKIFEYMAMKKPIIAPDTGSVKEVIDDGYNGILIKPGNKCAIHDKIIYLCKNRNLAKRISQNAYLSVLKNHTWKKNGEKIIDISSSIKI